jgi:hypothetical protein
VDSFRLDFTSTALYSGTRYADFQEIVFLPETLASKPPSPPARAMALGMLTIHRRHAR